VQGNSEVQAIIERDDGLFEVDYPLTHYFAACSEWPSRQRKAMGYARDHVLDIGCGAGRHALHLQREGFRTLGIDRSPLAVEVCRARGLKHARILPITRVSSKLGDFDTILMLGNNFGLFGNFKRSRWLLRRFHSLTSPRARIIAETLDPYRTEDPLHLQYHDWNRSRGRAGGQVRMRVRYRKYVDPWFDYLFVSKEELEQLLIGSGWAVERYLDSDGPVYIAVIRKAVT
jgi:SAM-dependent methyltransferase